MCAQNQYEEEKKSILWVSKHFDFSYTERNLEIV